MKGPRLTVQSNANSDQVDYWNAQAGATWAELQDRLDRQLEPLGLEAMSALGPKAGERILDIGCGCGQTSLELAEAGASVLGVDVSEPMLAVARQRAAGRDVAFEAADAQEFPFPPASFDAAFSRFGVMFFGDPPAAFANIARALKPGGRMAFVCWRPIAENVWMSLPFAAVAPILPPDAAPPPPADPHAPGPFAFADPERVRGILAAAGFVDIDIRPYDRRIGGNDLENSISVSLRVGPLGAVLRERPELRDRVVGALREALAEHLTPDGVLLPSATWIVTARKP